MDLVAMLLWATAAGGVISVVIGLARPSQRRAALILAAALFVPIGVLGILSVGRLFLAAALMCLIGAMSSRPPAEQAAEASP